MLAKKQRLDKKSCATLVKQGFFVNTPIFTVRYLGSNIPKYAVVIPKKIYPKSHDRNTLRRRVYDTISEVVFTNGKNITNVHVMIIAKTPIKSANQSVLVENIQKTLQHITKNL